MLIKKIRQNIAQLKPFKNNSNYIDLLNIPGNQNSSILLQIPKNYGKVRIKVDGKRVELTMGKKKKVITDKYNIFSGNKKTFYQENIWKSHKRVDIYVVPPKTGFYTELTDPKIIGATIYGKTAKICKYICIV